MSKQPPIVEYQPQDDHLRSHQRKIGRTITRGLLIGVLAFCSLFSGCYIMNGGLMFWNPKYSEKALLGLTSAQVVQRLGSASYDPRTRGGWISETQDGPLVIGYYNNWATTRIELRNDRVVSVQQYWK